MSVEKYQRVPAGLKGLSAGWVVGLAAAGLAAGLTAVGCGSGFGSCEDSRTCAPPGGASATSGEGGEPSTTADAGQAGLGGVAGGSGAPSDGGDASQGGAGPMCEQGLSACGGACVDTRSNPDHCGDCQTACAVGSICTDSACTPCPAKNIGCDGKCIDPATNAGFCGAAGKCLDDNRGAICTDSEVCGDGACLSDDASLKTLTLDPAKLTPTFSADNLAYEAAFSYFEPHLALKAEPSAADATMSYAGDAFSATDSVQLTATPKDDIASASVLVTAASGKKQPYDVTLKRAALATTYVKAFNSRASFGFGSSVALDGDTAVIGAPAEDSYSGGVDGNEASTGAIGAGAAYVAIRGSNSKWARQAYLKAESPLKDDTFGSAVAIDGNTIAVGAPGDNSAQGAVYIFARTGSTWSQQAIVSEPVPAGGNNFGTAVAIQGNRLVASSLNSGLVKYSGGAAYSFTRTGTTWKVDAKHPNPPAARYQSYDGFGYRLSLSGERLAVSEWQGERSVFVMLYSGSAWSVEGSITLPGLALEKSKIALDGDTLAASAPGVVHIFTRSGSSWTKQVSLTPFDAAATDGFGSSVALKGDLLAVGSGCDTCSGGVSTFVRSGTTWKDGAFVTAANMEANDAVGFSVAISGNRIVAGAPGEDSNATSFNQSSANNSVVDSGAAFIFE